MHRVDQDHFVELFLPVFADPIRVEDLEIRIVLLGPLFGDALDTFGKSHAKDPFAFRSPPGNDRPLALTAAPNSYSDQEVAVLGAPPDRAGAIKSRGMLEPCNRSFTTPGQETFVPQRGTFVAHRLAKGCGKMPINGPSHAKRAGDPRVHYKAAETSEIERFKAVDRRLLFM